MSEPDLRPPSHHVLRAFSADGSPKRLAGGQGRAWQAGSVVLKPLDMTADALRWQAEVLSRDFGDEVRVAAPLRGAGGDLVIDGWTAWPYLEGRTEPRRWPDVIEAGLRFHAVLGDVAEPAFLRGRTDNWAVGDRAAWDPVLLGRYGHVRHITRLCSLLKPVTAQAQVVHGDLTGNVLLHPALPPAVIDVSPYWRPVAFASAIVVADALVWEGAGPSLLDAVRDVPDFDQYLVRALACRVVTDWLFNGESGQPDIADDPYTAAVDLAVALVAQAR
jgi:uncharacterized protein (TIGR02569 family)